MQPVIEIEHLTKAYAGVQALADGCLDVLPGEVHGLIGANGAGKSTLIKILAGAVERDSGIVRMDGRAVVFDHERSAYDAGLRFIHQDLGIAPRLSVAENVFLGRRLPTRGGLVSVAKARAEASRILHGFIAVDPAAKMSSLGVAQQWMVAVARACTPDARVVVMDEPTAALSESEVRIVFDAVARLIERHLAVIFVSHRLPEILRLADRVTVMKDGRTVGTHPLANLSHASLVALITGEGGMRHEASAARPSPGTSAIALQVENLTGGPLKKVSLSARHGEILGVSGLVGSGRTSLLQHLFGAYRPESGRLLVDGSEVHLRSPADAVRHGIAMIPEERRQQGLLMLRSVRDNTVLTHLPLFRWRRRLAVPVRRRETEATSRQIEGLSVKATGTEQRVAELSGGNQQKVLLGRWLLGDVPSVLLLDEPTKGVDVRGKEELYAVVQDLARQGVAVIVVSSDLEELAAICDRTVVLVEGRVAGELSAPMTESEILEICYLGRAA